LVIAIYLFFENYSVVGEIQFWLIGDGKWI
jgi:hypothetical protein